MLYGINVFFSFALSYIISWNCHTIQELEVYKNTAIRRDKRLKDTYSKMQEENSTCCQIAPRHEAKRIINI